jgi:predicted porin
MQKKILVLALTAAIGGLAAGSAFADGNASLYGLLDYGLLNRAGSSGAANAAQLSQTAFNSGIAYGSRVGIKGAEDLGMGEKFIFELEYGINIDTNGTGSNSSTVTSNPSNPFWNRHSYIGFTGDTGTFVGGRVEGDRYSVSTKFDPFQGGTVGNFGSLIGNQARADNAVAYISPNWSGFSFLAAYTNNLTGNEHAGNAGDARLYAIRPEYSNGPLDVLFNYEDATVHGTGGDIRIIDFAGTYDFGVVKLYGIYDKINTGGVLDTAWGLDQKSYLIGLTAPINQFNLKFSYADIKNQNTGVTNGDCKKVSLGTDYALSKRTNFYFDVASIQNDSAASCSIATSAASYSGSNKGIVGVAVDSTLAGNTGGTTAFGTHGFDIGITHRF